MEDKIEKIFSYFGNIKNEPFYTSCISQIIQIYETNPQSLKFILYNLNQLIFSNCKQVRLRLKHRLICASLISKLNKIYVQRVKAFAQDKLNFELQNFQLDQNIYKAENKSKYERWQEQDLIKLIQTQDLLFASSKGKFDSGTIQMIQDEKKVFDQFIDMNHATMLNIQNAFKDVQIRNETTDEAYQTQKLKFRHKIDKIHTKSRQKIDLIQFLISNPFNLMYQICIGNLLHSQWQLRHLSVLILKQLVLHSQFLGFSQKFTIGKQQLTQNRFELISITTKQLLHKHMKQHNKKQIIDQIIYNCIKLLCLDRFADYQGDQSVILVRMIGAQILSICFKTLQLSQQTQLIKMIKKIFDKDTPFSQNKSKITWQVKHSFLYFLSILVQNDQSYGKLLCIHLQQCFIKMLANDQIDQITLCICKIIQTFLGQSFFTNQKLDRTNRQIWSVVQNLDDIAISAKDTLRLLLKLFPNFKLNQGNCIDRLKKFFTSKIGQVRLQLYKLIGCLYGKKKQINDSKLIQRNLVQLLQAGIIQYQVEIFRQVEQVMPHIMPYIIKTKNIRKIVEFINFCVTPNQYTQQIITSKFLMGIDKDKSQYTSNEYLYIYQHENVHSPLSAYTDKRLWKISLILKQMFKNSSQGLQQLLIAIQKNNERNHRVKILIYNLLIYLMPKYKKLKIYQQYKQQILKLLLLQFTEIVDNSIIKLYLPELQKQFKSILQNNNLPLDPNNKIPLLTLKQIYQNLKKNQFSLKNCSQIAKKLNILYNQDLDPIFLGDIEILLRILNNIVKIQRDLNKNIKILAVRYLLQYNQTSQIQNLNIVIKSIMDAMKDDNYQFISQVASKAALTLSLTMVKSKKIVYTRFNQNLCTHISTNYQISQLKLNQHENSIKLQGKFMGGICSYIQQIGTLHVDYLKQSWKYYLQQHMQPKDGRVPTIYEQYNRLLTLLSGTMTTILKIDKKQLDQQGYFINKFINKIKIILQKLDGPLKDSIYIKIKKILIDIFIYLSQNYTEISNIFFQWFLNQMQLENIIIFQVLEKVSIENIIKISSVASLFILQIIKSITIVKLHDLAMNSLSNLIVGVYTNLIKNNFSKNLLSLSQEGIQFVKNFKNSSNFNYKIQVKLSQGIDLRAYQIQGINWLGFLSNYNLSGALCDDMGLGKTLQTLVVLQNQYFLNLNTNQDYLHSLIICPNTLMQHWAFEYRKYFPNPICDIIILDKSKKLGQVVKNQKNKKPQLFITSYSMIQKQDNLFEKLNLKFIILDQGHLIKNTKTNKFKAIKKLKGLHRFILTGTPIQNRLIQLWGLFDFLMPGYLYTQQIFKKHYQKLFEVNLTTFKQDQLLFSQQQRKTLQKLHFKVMPFIMRRMKGDVLRQLPQKIINDYYCNLTQNQIKYYQNLEKRIKIQTQHKQINALSNLHQMIKIVNHPYLTDLQTQCKWQDSGKFIALGQLFQQFGFTDQDNMQHNKVIIFAKEKNTIDLIQKYLKDIYKDIHYLKLTSDIRQGDRFTVAQTFNGDLDIKILLVTKAIGGVGLNLSSANCVIMFDSDYNPTVDMQAIDRAHRIGQKRVLNVYRLITKDTLEQKIMANAIVNMDNASIKNVQQSKLPDLLQNVRDLQKVSKDTENKINNFMFSAIVTQMQKNAIETKQFFQKY